MRKTGKVANDGNSWKTRNREVGFHRDASDVIGGNPELLAQWRGLVARSPHHRSRTNEFVRRSYAFLSDLLYTGASADLHPDPA